MKAKKIAVVFSGCGSRDGSEITEAVSTILALSEFGAQTYFFAPNEEVSVRSPLDGEVVTPQQKRNAMLEAARISRGQIQPLQELNANDFDAVVFPGGFGAARVLSNWAELGPQASVNSHVRRVIEEFHQVEKPIGAICIAPTLVALVLGKKGVQITLGPESDTAKLAARTGIHHVPCEATDYVSDRDHKVLTTPAYMADQAKPHEVFTGIRKMIKELVEMA